jgi:pimeloyl-ACP methyl ester carboxylesterase
VSVVAEAAVTLAGGPFVFLGHSMGGMVALRAAALSPTCRGVALLAPAGLRANRGMGTLPPRAVLTAMARLRLTKALFYRSMKRAPIGVHASREDSDTTLALLSTLDYGPARQAARALRLPVLAASCLDDPLVEPAVIEELLAELPTQRHMVYERGGHAPQRDHAAELGAALVEFANACVPGVDAASA